MAAGATCAGATSAVTRSAAHLAKTSFIIGSPHPVTQMRTALTELAANARSGQTSHPCDVRFGREVGRVLAEAQRQIGARAR